jgi:UDP-N-acetylmuramate dehydrogenase
MDLALFCQKINIGPAAFFSGIPGSIGGALTMNAGAFGNETWNQVITAEVIDQKGRIQHLDRDQFGVSYRTVNFPFPLWFLSCVMSFSDEGKTTIEDLKELRNQRIKKQPLTEDTCGSVFKNPTDHFAGELIEQAGLKGFKIGSASISKKHANFIINEGGAKAEDIEKIIDHVRTVIKKKYDIDLHTEVRIIGEK